MPSRTGQLATVRAELLRGTVRVVFLAALIAAMLYLRAGETTSGNRALLLVLAIGLAVVAGWGVLETSRAVIRLRREGRLRG